MQHRPKPAARLLLLPHERDPRLRRVSYSASSIENTAAVSGKRRRKLLRESKGKGQVKGAAKKAS
jgi:hypothetical protein